MNHELSTMNNLDDTYLVFFAPVSIIRNYFFLYLIIL